MEVQFSHLGGQYKACFDADEVTLHHVHARGSRKLWPSDTPANGVSGVLSAAFTAAVDEVLGRENSW